MHSDCVGGFQGNNSKGKKGKGREDTGDEKDGLRGQGRGEEREGNGIGQKEIEEKNGGGILLREGRESVNEERERREQNRK